MMDDRKAWEVLSIVDEIPLGKVATYGQIARLAGMPSSSRLVGRILSFSSLYGDHPCHRVVNHIGRCATGWSAQRALLEEEGVGFLDNGLVDMKRFLWNE